ncbi:lysine N(6)-hydroxylase/L-ornithine N(5)-oxygenase family protein [Nocardia sp. NPDC060256]|uniref:lysine N(6)-hydroxylase/L-ornithine N(5)-oxygenase family protein n=1 Tax=unclassified Nocardia TaxID=2637762 RepID=UPI003652F067
MYDVVGVGFGPSNLALAIALEEQPLLNLRERSSALFFERQPTFGWHRHMLLPSATMQVVFLKDLATFRNPVSPFSFVSFLHASDRLAKFSNKQSFFPTRREFHQYLEWAASSFTDRVFYESEVCEVRLPSNAESGPAEHLEVLVRTPHGRRQVSARNIVVSTGLVPRMPRGAERGKTVWHSSEFLAQFQRADPQQLTRVGVVGAGQSAAEITRFLHTALPHATVYSIIPAYGYSIADDTPFANQIFDPIAVDDYYFGTARTREAFWQYHKNTNYSVVDDEVIDDLFRLSYEESLSDSVRLNFLNLTRVLGVEHDGAGTRVRLLSLQDGGSRDLDVDALVCATGYDAMDPSSLLGDLDRYCLRDQFGQYQVERDYRVATTPDLACGIYLQGGTEHTHGLSASLLSNIAVRSGEIAQSVTDRRGEGGLRSREAASEFAGPGPEAKLMP